jgi:hypothetical protein
MKTDEKPAKKPFVPHRIRLPNGIVIHPRVGLDGNLTPECEQFIKDCAKVKGPFPPFRLMPSSGPSASPSVPMDGAEKRSTKGEKAALWRKKNAGNAGLELTEEGLRAARAEWDTYVASGRAQQVLDAVLHLLNGGDQEGEVAEPTSQAMPLSASPSKHREPRP